MAASTNTVQNVSSCRKKMWTFLKRKYALERKQDLKCQSVTKVSQKQNNAYKQEQTKIHVGKMS